jgi:hypothetical protein
LSTVVVAAEPVVAHLLLRSRAEIQGLLTQVQREIEEIKAFQTPHRLVHQSAAKVAEELWLAAGARVSLLECSGLSASGSAHVVDARLAAELCEARVSVTSCEAACAVLNGGGGLPPEWELWGTQLRIASEKQGNLLSELANLSNLQDVRSVSDSGKVPPGTTRPLTRSASCAKSDF